MGSSSVYWQYARECAKWAAGTKDQRSKICFSMAKAWANIALLEGDVTKLVLDEKEAAQPLNYLGYEETGLDPAE